jgi:hydrogenase maturation factor
MCRSTVARVISIDGDDAVVEFDGVHRRASTLLVPDLVPGELVLIGLGTILGRVAPTDLDALRALEAGQLHIGSPPTSG